MRYFLLLITWFSVVISPAFAQDKCEALLEEVRTINEQIADIEAERALTESIRDMTESLNGAIDDINGSKKDAEAYEGKLEDLEELLGEKYEQFGAVVKGTKAGTAKFKKALGDTADGLSKAELAFRSYLKAREADSADPAESLKLLADSYDFLQGALGPLINEVPIIGQFLTAYGEALKSASAIATKLQNERNKQADIVDKIPELNGGNPFRFPSATDLKLKKLNARRTKLMADLDENGCEEPEEEEAEAPEEVKQARIVARRQCISELKFDPDPVDAYHTATQKKDKILKAYYAAVKAQSAAYSDIPQKERKLKIDEQFAKIEDDRSANLLALLKIEPGYQTLLTRIQKVVPGFPDKDVVSGCSVADAMMGSVPGEQEQITPPGLKSAMNAFCKIQPTRAQKRKTADTTKAQLEAAKSAAPKADSNVKRLSDESVQASREIRKARKDQDRLADCVFEKSDPIDISGRYWSRYTEDILIVKRVGPNYSFFYEEPSTEEQNLRGVKKGDEWFIGRLEDGYLKGIYRQRLPLSVQSEWGCANRGGWVSSEGKIWASGGWLSFTAKTKYINANCEIRDAGDTFTVYKEGSEYYKQFKP